MTKVQEALRTDDAGLMAEAYMERGEIRETAIRWAVVSLEFGWDGAPTGITSADVERQLAGRGL